MARVLMVRLLVLSLSFVNHAQGCAVGTETAPTRTITISVLVAHGIMTFVALRYVMHQMQKIKGHVVDERRKARCVLRFLS